MLSVRSNLFFRPIRLLLGLGLFASGVGFAQEESQPYLPSPVRVAGDIPFAARHVAASMSCGQTDCHPDIADQWASSAHHFSSFSNPFYKASVEFLMEDDGGIERARWCAGCHDPALLLTGTFKEGLDPKSELATEGVGCLICHAAEEPVDLRGNGGYRIRAIEAVPLSQRSNGLLQKIGRSYLRMKPARHQKMLLRPLHERAEFCMSCHKVAVPADINGYRWKRGQNEYDSWHHSGISGNNAASFYFRRNPATCIDCHMREVESQDRGNDDGRIASHRFAAANSALPFLRQDETQLEAVRDQLQRGSMRLALSAVESEEGELRSPNDPALSLAAADRLMFYLSVRNLDVGHAFPGGTTDSHEAWLHVRAVDASGRLLMESGGLLADGSVDPNSRVYRSRLIDADARLIEKRDVQHWVATAYTTTIAPGTADVARYVVPLDATLQWPIEVQARLRHRKFRPRFTRWVYHADHESGAIPELPIIDVASLHTTLASAEFAPGDAKSLAADWNDLGIALFLQEDRVRAAECFSRAATLDSTRADLRLNRARIAIADGDLELADQWLAEAERLERDHPTLRLLRARVDAAHGRQEAAIASYRRLLEELPLDRGVWVELAETLYFSGDYAAALGCYDRVLEIDPESLAGHNGRLVSLRALGRPTADAMAAVNRYKAAESEEALAGRWLRAHPIENRSSRPAWRFDPTEERP
jgi:Flp pilus assembly protein TadD